VVRRFTWEEKGKEKMTEEEEEEEVLAKEEQVMKEEEKTTNKEEEKCEIFEAKMQRVRIFPTSEQKKLLFHWINTA